MDPTRPKNSLRQNIVFSCSEMIPVSFSFFLSLFLYFSFLCYVICFVIINFAKIVFYLLLFLLLFIIIIIIIIFIELINYFFIKKYFNFFMFRDVPCSGFYRRPPKLHFFELDREFFCLLPSLARLYSAAASPSERLRSDGSLAIKGLYCFANIHAKNQEHSHENSRNNYKA